VLRKHADNIVVVLPVHVMFLILRLTKAPE
jgi:hypothetical protein